MSADTRPRDALVEAAVSTAYTRQFGHGRWEAASEETRRTWRETGSWFVPGAVEFVAGWLADRLERQQLHHPVEAWREDMAE